MEAEARECSARRSKRRGGAGGRHSGVDERWSEREGEIERREWRRKGGDQGAG